MERDLAVKIGIDIRELERGTMTGIGRYLCNFLADATVVRPEHCFVLYGNQHTATADLRFPHTEVRIVRERLTQWWDQIVLSRLARQDRLDLFFSPYIKGPLFLPCPLVTTIHDLMFLVHPAYAHGRTAGKRWLFRRMARLVARRAAAIITDSEYARQDIMRLLGVPREKLVVLPIGITAAYRPIHDPQPLTRVTHHYGISRPYILYVGNFKPHKNVTTLLDAFARLPKPIAKAHQLVLGGAWDTFQPAHAALAAALGLAERVIFPGFIAEPDLPALYSAAALFVLPSTYEGFGLPVLEAMACGTPVICGRVTSLPEVVGDSALLIDPHNAAEMAVAIERGLSDPVLRQALRAQGLQRAQRFTPQHTARRVLVLLERVVHACQTHTDALL
jgi:alpha-1,3-rhamnosyl/mannosyltransferase